VTAPIRPDQLVRHARAMAHHHAGAGRPRLVWLRRSTSASYYAVFHAIALAVATQLSPGSAPDDRYRLTRSIGHDRVLEVCRWLTKRDSGRHHVRPVVTRLRRNADLVRLGEIFVRLQQVRHEADYDHLASVRKAATVAHNEQAATALELVEHLRGTTDGQEFFALVALHSSLR
jgi:hypothetical protein